MKPFSLYDDEGVKTLNITSEESNVLEIDLSEPQTLFTMSSKVRDFLRDKPDDYQLTIYLVCGRGVSKDAGLFVEYLKDVVQPILVVFRGIVHFDFIHLFLEREIHVNQTSQIMYSKDKLHDTMKNFLLKPDAYKRFMQRFVDEYWKLNEGNMLSITELEILGIKTKPL